MPPEAQAADVTSSEIPASEIRPRTKEINVAGLDTAECPDHAMLREELNRDLRSLLEIGVELCFSYGLNPPGERCKAIQSCTT